MEIRRGRVEKQVGSRRVKCQNTYVRFLPQPEGSSASLQQVGITNATAMVGMYDTNVAMSDCG